MSKASGSNSKTFRETLTIWPHRSLSPRGFLVVMGSLGLLAFCIGLGFFLLGAWPVIGFLGLELLVVWGAFKLNYRAARRRQHVTATAAKLKIENVSPQGRRDTTELPTAWVRVELTPRDEPESHSRQRRKVLVRSHGRTAVRLTLSESPIIDINSASPPNNSDMAIWKGVRISMSAMWRVKTANARPFDGG